MTQPTHPLWTLLAPARRTRVIDIGANPIDGEPPYRPLLTAGLCELVGFEPQPEALARLQAQQGPHERYLPHVVGDGQPHTLRVCRAPGMTSLFKPDARVLRHFHGFEGWGVVEREVPVSTVRLDDVPGLTGLDYLKIDVQGSELSIFQHGRRLLAGAVVVQAEVSFIPLYEGQPHFADVDAELRAQGFVFHTFQVLNRRVLAPMLINDDPYAGLNQVLEADAVYVRDFTRFEVLDDEQLTHLALVAHEVYRSYDLANLALNELDRRHQRGLALAYGEWLSKTLSGPA